MGISRKFGALLLTGALLAASQASAATLTFNFGGNGGLQAGNSMVFTSGGKSVTVTAGANALNNEFDLVSRIAQYSEGLGNSTNYKYTYCDEYRRGQCVDWDTDTVSDDSHEVDDWIETNSNHGVREFLKLDFGALNVSITNIDFGYHESNDDAQVKINNSTTQIYSGGADPITSGSFSAYSPTNMFWFIAGGGSGNNNDWKLKSVTVSYDDTPGGPGRQEDVPVPAALSLMGLGLAGLGFVRRRKS